MRDSFHVLLMGSRGKDKEKISFYFPSPNMSRSSQRMPNEEKAVQPAKTSKGKDGERGLCIYVR